MPRIVARLPALGDVVVDGWPFHAAVPNHPVIGPAAGPAEDLLRAATRLAIGNHPGNGPDPGDGAVALELRGRRRIRRLLEIRRGYEGAKRRYELSIRLQDEAFERMVRPPSGAFVPSRASFIQGLIDALGRGLEAQDRLVALWTSFRAERLALYRDLGVLPYDNGEAFYADLAAPAEPALGV